MFFSLRQVFRQFRQSKGFVAATLVTLALCIGATTAIFSTVYSLMLKSLPFDEPERIVELYTSAAKAGLNKMPANIPFYLDYSKNSTSYEMIGLWTMFQGMYGAEDAVVRLPGARITAEIFPLLRIQPVIGTFFRRSRTGPEPTRSSC
jgi:putative ABC transport system permease protein